MKEESKEKLTYLKSFLQDTSTVPFSHPQSVSNFNPLMHKHTGGAAPGESQAVSRQAQQCCCSCGRAEPFLLQKARTPCRLQKTLNKHFCFAIAIFLLG